MDAARNATRLQAILNRRGRRRPARRGCHLRFQTYPYPRSRNLWTPLRQEQFETRSCLDLSFDKQNHRVDRSETAESRLKGELRN